MAVRRDLRKSMPIHADPVIAKFCTLPAVKCLINAETVQVGTGRNLSDLLTSRELTARATSTQNPDVLPTESHRLFIYGTRTSFYQTGKSEIPV